MVTMSVVASPPWAGSLVGVEVFEERAEREAELAAVRDPVLLPQHRVIVLTRGGVGLQVGPQPGGVGVGQDPGQPGRPVPDRFQGESAGLAGALFLLLQRPGFLGLGDVGGHDFQDPASEAADLGGGELVHSSTRCAFGLGDEARVEVGGQRLQGVHDRPGVGHRHGAVGHPGRDLGPRPVQRRGEPGIGPRWSEVGMGQRAPSRHRRRGRRPGRRPPPRRPGPGAGARPTPSRPDPAR